MDASYQELRRRWDASFADASQTVNTLRLRGVRGGVLSEGVRSVWWKVYLGVLPTLDQSSWQVLLDGERRVYDDLRRLHLVNPAETSSEVDDLLVNNPLSQAEDSPWTKYFEGSDLRKVISQDVERTFPDSDYFRLPEKQQQMIDILFIWCKLNPDVSYRQGMHELLAPVLWVVDADSIDSSSASTPRQVADSETVMRRVLDKRYAEHDAFALFERLMRAAKPWYEFNDDPSWGKRSAQLLRSRTSPSTSDRAATVSPVVAHCQKIQGLLKLVDPILHAHLESMSIEPQLYGIRWLRLLFSREFPLEVVYRLWDCIFADDPGLGSVIYVCLAMLLFIRDDLLISDYAGCLHRLMKFPPGAQVDVLFEQALKLREKLTPQCGARIIIQNARLAGKTISDDVASLAIQPEEETFQYRQSGGHHRERRHAEQRHRGLSNESRDASDSKGAAPMAAVRGGARYRTVSDRSQDAPTTPSIRDDVLVQARSQAAMAEARRAAKDAAKKAAEIERLRLRMSQLAELVESAITSLISTGPSESADSAAPGEKAANANGPPPGPPDVTSVLTTLRTVLETLSTESLREVEPVSASLKTEKVASYWVAGTSARQKSYTESKKITPHIPPAFPRALSSPSRTVTERTGDDVTAGGPAVGAVVAARENLTVPPPPLSTTVTNDQVASNEPTKSSSVAAASKTSGVTPPPSPAASFSSMKVMVPALLSPGVAGDDHKRPSPGPKSPTSPPIFHSVTVSTQSACKQRGDSPLKFSLEDILNDGTEFAAVGGGTRSDRKAIAGSAHSWMFGEEGSESSSNRLFGGGGSVMPKLKSRGILSTSSSLPVFLSGIDELVGNSDSSQRMKSRNAGRASPLLYSSASSPDLFARPSNFKQADAAAALEVRPANDHRPEVAPLAGAHYEALLTDDTIPPNSSETTKVDDARQAKPFLFGLTGGSAFDNDSLTANVWS